MSRHGEPLVSGRNLSLGYGKGARAKVVVTGLDVAIHPGQLTCLIGPNGAGKSTLLRALSGLISPVGGTLMVGGAEPSRMRPAQLARTMALVLNERPANAGIRVEELVSLGRLPFADAFGRLSRTDLAAIDVAMESTATAHLRGRHFGDLSDGERARVHVARALAQDTPLVLMDEPTAHLDWPHRIALCTLLGTLVRERGKAVLLSTHEIDLALQMADQWILLAPGCPPVCAAPEEIALRGHFDAAFGHDGFRLDALSGQLRLERPASRPVRVEGLGDVRNWTVHALERRGWKCDETAGPLVRVADGPAWELDGRTHGSLAGLLHGLASLPQEAA
jgi:iron complex transport system ATP-binding protein